VCFLSKLLWFEVKNVSFVQMVRNCYCQLKGLLNATDFHQANTDLKFTSMSFSPLDHLILSDPRLDFLVLSDFPFSVGAECVGPD
jgi:hypothetical protein